MKSFQENKDRPANNLRRKGVCVSHGETSNVGKIRDNFFLKRTIPLWNDLQNESRRFLFHLFEKACCFLFCCYCCSNRKVTIALILFLKHFLFVWHNLNYFLLKLNVKYLKNYKKKAYTQNFIQSAFYIFTFVCTMSVFNNILVGRKKESKIKK